jgi:hypothetical protein
MKTAAEYIAAEIMDTIERERRINKDDLVLAAEIAIRKHDKAVEDANPIVGMVVDRCQNPGVYTYGGAADRERQAVEQWIAKNRPQATHVVGAATPVLSEWLDWGTTQVSVKGVSVKGQPTSDDNALFPLPYREPGNAYLGRLAKEGKIQRWMFE